MAQTKKIVATLKNVLKAHGKTYADVADTLGMAESSIKRLFADNHFSLQRLEQICAMVDMEVSELAKMADEVDAHIDELSFEQEKELVSDVRLVLVTNCILNHWTFEQLLETYKFTEHQLIQMLARLDRLKLIQLQPHNRVKLLVSRNFAWRKNGPIQQFFEAEVQSKFFKCDFTGAGEMRLVLNGMLSRRSHAFVTEKLQRLAREFEEYNQEDGRLPMDDRFGMTMVLAMRPWELDVFEQYRYHPNQRRFAEKDSRAPKR